jgi:hypothetical protein
MRELFLLRFLDYPCIDFKFFDTLLVSIFFGDLYSYEVIIEIC